MNKDQVLGLFILLGSIGGVVVYFYLAFLSPWALFTIQLSAFLAMAAVLLIVAWIGYTMATTPPPTPFESLENSDKDDLANSEGEDKEIVDK